MTTEEHFQHIDQTLEVVIAGAGDARMKRA
jgi:hypothetical protein